MKSTLSLTQLFITNPSSAIEESQKIICYISKFDSYKSFYSYHDHHPHNSTCQKEWTNEQMSIHCFNCANNSQSHVCLQCFLNGNHQNHDYIIIPNSTGNCDCGDTTLWNRSGFCNKHKGEEDDSHPEKYLDDKLKTVLTENIFKSAFLSLKDLQKDKDNKFTSIFEFLSSFLKFGDGFKRLLSISLIEKINFEDFFNGIFESTKEFNQMFQNLCLGLITDNFFKAYFSRIVFKLMNQRIIPDFLDVILMKKDDTNYNIWNSFWFHCFSPKPIKFNVKKLNWDWVTFTIEYSNEAKEFFSLKGMLDFHFNLPNYFNEINSNIPIASQIQPNEQTQRLFDELFSKVLNCGTKDGLKNGKNDTIIVSSFIEEHEKSYYKSIFLFNRMFYYLLFCFDSKENLKLDKLFEELNNSIDISPIYNLNKNNNNNKFISKFVNLSDNQKENDFCFKSFHDGSPFFYSFPLYDSLVFLFRLDDFCRIKIAKLFSIEKYQSLRIQLCIVTLKKIIAFVCYHQSLVSSKNISLNKFFSFTAKSSNSVLFGIPYYIPLFQLLIGLNSNSNEFSLKEFFAFEMVKEIGLFDNFNSKSYEEDEDEDVTDKQTQMIFSVLYFSILIVIERNLFNFDGFKFIEEQVILALKQGISNLDELNNSCDQEANKFTKIKQSFNKVLSKVAKTDRHSNKSGNDDGNDSSFYLKEGIKWNTISGINPFNNQEVILNNEISENPNKLIKINEFEPEEKFFFFNKIELSIQLKEFLFTPTVLAIVYHTLRSKETEFPEVELNDHLAMNILILISKFVQENSQSTSSSQFNESTHIIEYDSTLIDLITKFRVVVFNYKVDSKEIATIENTINNKKSFNFFMKMKISSTKFEPKSFIDLILEKGQIGKNVLKRMSIDDVEISNEESHIKVEDDKKKKVNKLKEKILNHFKNEISNYRLNNIDLAEENESSSDFDNVCSVCSTTRENEVLSYPIYIYRTKFPFIIDKPPLIKINPLEEFSVDDDRDDEPSESEDDSLLNEEEDEEEEAPDLPRMISKLNEIDDHEEDQLQSQIYSIMFDPDLLNRESRSLRKKQRKVLLEEKQEREERNQIERKKLLKLKDPKTGKIEVERRCTAGNNFVIQFGICQHLVHSDCVNKDAFKCSMDRSFKNGFLPAIDGLSNDVIFKKNSEQNDETFIVNSETLSDEIKDSLFLFIDNFASYFFKPQYDVFVELVKSIGGLIATYEIRLRSLPDCLDSKKTKFLARNLFLTTWYSYRACGKPKMVLVSAKNNENVDKRLSLFQRFIKKLIEIDDLQSINNNNEKFRKIVSSFVKLAAEKDLKRKEKEIFLFLRRVCLSDYFLLNNNVSSKKENNSFIDWDGILSLSNLSQRYGIQFKKINSEFEFNPFFFSKLPHNFLNFALNPFKFPIEKTSKFALFSILDYNRLIKDFDDFDETNQKNDDENELKKNKKNVHSYQFDTEELNVHLLFKHSKRVYPSVFLFVGKNASKIVITNMGKIGVLKPFYLDGFQCSDVGFKRKQPLFLNDDRYERTMDEILSGDFCRYLPL